MTGTWDDQQISKEPVEDISAATLELLQEVLLTGGRLGPSVHGAFGEMFLYLSTMKTSTQPASTATTTIKPGPGS